MAQLDTEKIISTIANSKKNHPGQSVSQRQISRLAFS